MKVEYQHKDKEKRISNILVGYWNRLRGENELPLAREIKKEELKSIWDSCFVVQLEDIVTGDGYNYRYLGDEIKNAYGCDLADSKEIKIISTVASKLDAQYRGVLGTRMPMEVEGEFTNAKGQTVFFRQCMVPFSMDSVNGSAVLGGMRYKIYG